jgi:acetolactate synthase-1/2/3 large subunit
VHLSIPNDVLDAVVHAALPTGAQFDASDDFFPEENSDRVLDVLVAAKRPVIITGPAMMNARGRERMQRIEDATGIPVIGMESPRGVNDPSLGRLAEVLRNADVALLLGKRLDFTLKFGKAFAADCRVLEADPRLTGWAGRKWQASSWLEETRAALRYRPPEWSSVRSKAEGPVHPVELCNAVQKLLEAPDAVLVADGGEFGQWAQACLSAPHRVINGPAGAIGSALPFAAAAKLAFPDAPVVAMLGDGTFGFHMSEIDTAVRYDLSYLAVIGNDATWNAEYQIQLRAYGAERAQGCELLPTRYGAVAAAMGAHGEDVPSVMELDAALGRAMRAGLPACVNVMIERLPAPRYSGSGS